MSRSLKSQWNDKVKSTAVFYPRIKSAKPRLPKLHRPIDIFHVEFRKKKYTFPAYTKSEARAQLKKILFGKEYLRKSLPMGIQFTKE